MKVNQIAKWIYDNRRVIGVIVGSVLTLCGLDDAGNMITRITEVT